MRDLTAAEYQAALALLSWPEATERERIRASGLPTSTYNVVHRRIVDEGWLAELLIPNPGPVGVSGVEFHLSRPTVPERPELLRVQAADPECVLLWAGLHATFAIYYRTANRAPALVGSTRSDLPEGCRLCVSVEEGSVPVYFDYAGLWSRFGHRSPAVSYPRGLDTRSTLAGPRLLAEARQVLEAAPRATDASGPGTAAPSVARTHPGLLTGGVVQVRTVLRQERVPPLEGRRLGEIIFITGRTQSRTGGASLLNRLVHECGVFPFLMAESGGHVVLAGLGQTRADAPGRVVIPSASRPVTATLNEELKDTQIMIEPVEAVREVVSHRYAPLAALGRSLPNP